MQWKATGSVSTNAAVPDQRWMGTTRGPGLLGGPGEGGDDQVTDGRVARTSVRLGTDRPDAEPLSGSGRSPHGRSVSGGRDERGLEGVDRTGEGLDVALEVRGDRGGGQ